METEQEEKPSEEKWYTSDVGCGVGFFLFFLGLALVIVAIAIARHFG